MPRASPARPRRKVAPFGGNLQGLRSSGPPSCSPAPPVLSLGPLLRCVVDRRQVRTGRAHQTGTTSRWATTTARSAVWRRLKEGLESTRQLSVALDRDEVDTVERSRLADLGDKIASDVHSGRGIPLDHTYDLLRDDELRDIGRELACHRRA